MNYFIESIIVGIYCCVIYIIINKLIIKQLNNLYLILFLSGLIKHLFGYLLNIHTLYCNYGFACNNFKNPIKKHAFYSSNLILESLIEGLLFLSLGFIIISIDKNINKLLLVFIIGILLHIISEKIGIHHLFCKLRCKS